MQRSWTRILLSFAVALGLSVASAGFTSPSHGATTTASPTISGETSMAKSGTCAKQRKRTTKTKRVVTKRKKQVRKAKRQHRHHAVKKHKKQLKKAKVRHKKAKKALKRCRRAQNHGNDGPSTASPIQALCDAGLPQPICDALAGLAPGGDPADQIQTLCDNGVPQEVCDGLAQLLQTDPGDPGSAVDALVDLLGGIVGQLPEPLGPGLADLLEALAGSGVPTIPGLPALPAP